MISTAVNNATNDEILCEVCFSCRYDKQCKYCNVKLCNSCIKTTILNYAQSQPHCLNCDTEYTVDEIYEIFKCKGFQKEYIPRSIELAINKDQQKTPLCVECCSKIKENEYKSKIYNNASLISINIQHFIEFVKSTIKNASESVKIEPNDENNELSFMKRLTLYYINNILDYYYTLSAEEYKSCRLESIISTLNVLRTLQLTNDEKNDLLFKARVIIEKFDSEFLAIIDKEGKFNSSIPCELKVINDEYNKYYNKQLGKSVGVKYLFRCPTNNCAGYINSEYYCALCRNKFCSKCLGKLDNEQHTCKESDVLTMEEINKSTKPCPKCTSRIYKISGCSQMFCTNCKIGFDWNTGKIINSNFHNPHRMEWLRMNGGVEGCNNVFDVKYSNNHDILFTINQRNHINEMRRKLDEKLRFSLDDRTYYRNLCYYMLGYIDKNKYEYNIRTYELNKMKYNYLISIYDQFIHNASDILMSCKDKDDSNYIKITDYLKNIYKITRVDYQMNKKEVNKFLSFLDDNGLIKAMKTIGNVDMEDNEYCKIIREICDTDKLFIPNGMNKIDLINLTVMLRKIIITLYEFDDDVVVLKDIRDECNAMLVKYAKMFNLHKCEVIANPGTDAYIYSKNL